MANGKRLNPIGLCSSWTTEVQPWMDQLGGDNGVHEWCVLLDLDDSSFQEASGGNITNHRDEPLFF
jgi:hypothetical protein